MIKMTRRDRLEATLAGQPVDRVAVALWRHFPVDDQYADELARAHLEFQQLYDFDFIKVTPSYTYCVADWGVEDRYDGNNEGIFDITRWPIRSLDDWRQLRPQDPRMGARGEQLRCLELIRDTVREDTPFIPTVFNPLGMLLFLAGEETALAHLRREPTLMKDVLEILAQTTVRFVEEAMKRGAAGIFYALLYANYRQVTEGEYVEFGQPYDLRVLEAARDGWLNILHLHGDEVRFDLMSRYPVPAISWDDRSTPPSLAEAATQFTGALVGGISQWGTMLRGRPAQVRAEIQDAIRQTAGRRLIVGTGCVTPITTPTCNIRAARLAVESVIR
jgi:uroporphyrinogen decarboxylase